MQVEANTVIVRAANEGIPVGAIARIIQLPFEEVSEDLRAALACGTIGAMPKSDWPPTARAADHLPTIPRTLNLDDVAFAVRREFKLTKLETGFMTVLMHQECADKAKLHGVIEQQRAERATRLDKQELTDPKMVDVIICKLRKKLLTRDGKVVLQTSWGHGYYFDANVKQIIYQLIGVPPCQESPLSTSKALNAPSETSN